MEFDSPKLAMYSGIILNIIASAIATVFLYLILLRCFKGSTYYKKKSAILTLVSATTYGAISTILYIRMYALVGLIVLVTSYLHLRIQEKEEISVKLYVLTGVVALVGSLTHYYYLFFFLYKRKQQIY